jgi:hypothetical protein
MSAFSLLGVLFGSAARLSPNSHTRQASTLDPRGRIMKTILDIVLPAKIDNTVRGSKLPFYVFVLFAIISIARSCVHLLSPDGGAGSIAGMNLSVPGGDGIVFAFALWGSSQLLLALIQLLVVVRYRALVPLMYVMLILEVLLRALVGYMKPVTFAHPPPGAIGNQVVLPLAVLMLALSLWSAYKNEAAG